jgi:hypothetical protein
VVLSKTLNRYLFAYSLPSYLKEEKKEKDCKGTRKKSTRGVIGRDLATPQSLKCLEKKIQDETVTLQFNEKRGKLSAQQVNQPDRE